MDTPPHQHENADDAERFIRLFTANERRIYAYILALLGNLADADDVLQETSVVLWRQFDQYTPGTSFTAWAFAVARNKVMTHRQTRRRSRLRFNPALIDTLSEELAARQQQHDRRHEALAQCIEQLPPRDRDLIRRRYEPGATIKSIAAAVGRPVQGMYKAMRRIEDALHDCVTRKMRSEDRS